MAAYIPERNTFEIYILNEYSAAQNVKNRFISEWLNEAANAF